MPISLLPYSISKPSIMWLSILPPWSSSSHSPSPSSPSSPSPPPPLSSQPQPQHQPPEMVELRRTAMTTTTTMTNNTATATATAKRGGSDGGGCMMMSLMTPAAPTTAMTMTNGGGCSGRKERDEDKVGVITETNDNTPLPVSMSMSRSSSSGFVRPVGKSPASPPPPPPPCKDTMEEDAVWLFDLRTARGGVPWHPNTWKVRLALNYKRIPYRTIWLTYPSMQPVMQELGVRAVGVHDDDVGGKKKKRKAGEIRVGGEEHYTVPVIIDRRRVVGEEEEVQAVVGSRNVLEYLDAMFPDTNDVWTMFPSHSPSPSPSPRSHPHSRRRRPPPLLQTMFDSMIERVLDPPFWKMIIPLAWMNSVLDEESKSYFMKIRRSKSKSGSGSNEKSEQHQQDWNPVRYATAKEWDALREGFETIAAFCEMYGIGGVWCRRARVREGGEHGEQREKEWVLTRVEIVLVAYLAALHECAPRERWNEIGAVWSGGMWGVLWEGSARWRRVRV